MGISVDSLSPFRQHCVDAPDCVTATHVPSQAKCFIKDQLLPMPMIRVGLVEAVFAECREFEQENYFFF